MSVVEGFQMYGSLWRNNRDLKVCPFISQVSAVEGCPLGGVPL